jgi:hypothetical protein
VPPGRSASSAATTSSTWRSASDAIADSSTRHRASGRRRSTPSPLQGASTSTRSNASASHERAAPAVGDDGCTVGARADRPRRATSPRRPASHVARHHQSVRADPFRHRGALAARAAHTSSTRVAGLWVEHVDHHLAGLVLRRRPALGHRRAARAGRRCRARRPTTPPTLPLHRDARARELGDERLRGRPGRVRSQRDRGRLVLDSSAARASASPRVGPQPVDQPVGVRQRHRVVAVLGQGGPADDIARSTAFT